MLRRTTPNVFETSSWERERHSRTYRHRLATTPTAAPASINRADFEECQAEWRQTHRSAADCYGTGQCCHRPDDSHRKGSAAGGRLACNEHEQATTEQKW